MPALPSCTEAMYDTVERAMTQLADVTSELSIYKNLLTLAADGSRVVLSTKAGRRSSMCRDQVRTWPLHRVAVHGPNGPNAAKCRSRRSMTTLTASLSSKRAATARWKGAGMRARLAPAGTCSQEPTNQHACLHSRATLRGFFS